MSIDPKELEKISFNTAGEVAGYLRDLYGLGELSIIVGKGASGDTTRRIDALAEEYAIELLRNTGYNLLIVSEEKGVFKISDPPELIVLMDPLDGSLNYTLGIPAVSVSIVFYSIDKPYLVKPLAGAIANVFLREIISFDDINVYINKIRVEKYKPSKSGIAVVYTNDPNIFVRIHKFMKGAFEYSTRLRVLGSAALESVYAGLGRIDLFFHNTGKLRNLDVAGGIGVALRLGAAVLDLDEMLNNYRADRIEFLKSLIIGEPRIVSIKEYFTERSSGSP